jgi:sucrose-6-phosphate hydrolase SacC (GH32 family)
LEKHTIGKATLYLLLFLANDLRVGEDKTDGSAFQNINCYSSNNLVEWKYEGALLTRQGSGDLGPSRVIERPKVIYNKSTKQYVLWMHIDSSDYGDAKIGVATGSTVCGQFSYKGSFRPLGFESRDSGVFVDDDEKGYLLTEDVSSRPILIYPEF